MSDDNKPFALLDTVWAIWDGKASKFQIFEINRRITETGRIEEWCYVGVDVKKSEVSRHHFALDRVFATKQELIDFL